MAEEATATRSRRWGRGKEKERVQLHSQAQATAEDPIREEAPLLQAPSPASLLSETAARASRTVTGFGAGDSYLVEGFLSVPDADAALHALSPVRLGGLGEVAWMQLYGANGKPFGRLKFTQASLGGGQEPIYRYPANNQAACETQPWSPTVERLKARVEELTSQPMNHCVGNFYKNQHDFIGPHSDKMLDIKQGSCIASLSLGVARPMVLERKQNQEQRQEIQLPHGSLFVIGARTNQEWLHAIPSVQEELGHRISLTIRQMATFRDTSTGRITGQGEASQTPNWPQWSHNLSIVPTVVHPRAQSLPEEVQASCTVGGSSFHCFLQPFGDAAAVERRWRQLRAEFPEACHVPYAWVFRSLRSQPSQAKQAMRRRLGSAPVGCCSDGEPELPTRQLHTGNDGLLEPLLRSGWTDCAAFVVRHWDGQRLGADRLVRAYAEVTGAAAAAAWAAKASASSTDETVLPMGAAQSAEAAPLVVATPLAAAAPKDEKRMAAKEVMKLKKTLREIALLEQQMAEGLTLQSNQLQKVARKDEVTERLAVLSLQKT